VAETTSGDVFRARHFRQPPHPSRIELIPP